MINAERILQTLDRHLDHAVSLAHLLPVTRPPVRWLRLFRPATLDLMLTKMMRGDDAQDMADIAFMVRHDRVTAEQIEAAIAGAVIPDLQELHDAFARAKPRVREIVGQAASER